MTSENHSHPEHRMAYGWFTIRTLLTLAAAFGFFRLIAPAALETELQYPWRLLFWTAVIGLPMSLFEYLYHRFLLHSAVLPFLGSMHGAHAEHHGLTSVKAPVTPKEPERMVAVRSEYPIEHDHQEESMMFPGYALPIFYGVFFVIIALPLKAIFPLEPIVSGMLVCVTLFFSWYEVWHAFLHLPYEEFWKPRMEHPVYGRIVRHVYAFHLMHHWRPVSNLAVVGLWGVAIWDHLFRTHHRPRNTPIHESMVNYYDAKLPKPLWPVSMMDRWQPGMYKFSRWLERTLAKPFKRRPTPGSPSN
jgi:hypothetical protein